MQCIRSRKVTQFTPPILGHNPGGHIPNCRDGLGTGTEVPALTIVRRGVPHLLCEQHITAQRFKHMLPGTDSLRAADIDCPSRFQSLDAVRNDTVQGPVSTTDNVTSSYTGDGFSVFIVLLGVEERTTHEAIAISAAPLLLE